MLSLNEELEILTFLCIFLWPIHSTPPPFLSTGTGDWILGFVLAWQALYYLSHALSSFAFSFSDGVLCFCLGQPQTTDCRPWFSCLCLLRVAGITSMCHHAQLVFETVLLTLPSLTSNLPISAFWVVQITGMGQYAQLNHYLLHYIFLSPLKNFLLGLQYTVVKY
jgi:hypothetical protein